MIRSILIFFLVSLIISGCECVPGIDTPKIKEPAKYANLAIINILNDRNFIRAESEEIVLYDKLSRLQDTEYKKFETGSVKYLSIYTEDRFERFINLPLNLQEENFYTLILFTYANEIQYRLIDDTDYREKMVNLRLMNLSDTDYNLKISSGENEITKDFNANSSSSFVQFIPNKYIITVMNDGEVFFEEEYDLNSPCNADFICYKDDLNKFDIVKIDHPPENDQKPNN